MLLIATFHFHVRHHSSKSHTSIVGGALCSSCNAHCLDRAIRVIRPCRSVAASLPESTPRRLVRDGILQQSSASMSYINLNDGSLTVSIGEPGTVATPANDGQRNPAVTTPGFARQRSGYD